MGAGSDLKEENRQLKKKIENELEPEINRLTQVNSDKEKIEIKLKKEVDILKNKVNEAEKDLSPEEIQEIMVENANLHEQINQLKSKYEFYKNSCINLKMENNKLKLACGQYQLMLLKNMQTPLNNNLNNLNNFKNQFGIYKKKLNKIINNNDFNFINNPNNNIKQSINNNSDNIITIIFNFDNKMKYPFVTLPEYKLGNIFSVLSTQIGGEYSNIHNLEFFYMTRNITKYFINNEDVRSLNFSTYSPIIEVMSRNT